MARGAEDLALLYRILAGPRAQEAPGWRLVAPPPRPKPWRIAVCTAHESIPTDEEVSRAVRGAADSLSREPGVTVVWEALPPALAGCSQNSLERIAVVVVLIGRSYMAAHETANPCAEDPQDSASGREEQMTRKGCDTKIRISLFLIGCLALPWYIFASVHIMQNGFAIIAIPRAAEIALAGYVFLSQV